MRKYILIVFLCLAGVFAVYPPFQSKGEKADTPLHYVKATEYLINVVEQNNDQKVIQLHENIATIDSLNTIPKKSNFVAKKVTKHSISKQPVEKKRNFWQKITGVFRKK